MNQKTAIVTGANRGIGLEISKQLGQLGVKVIMTARNEEKGRAAYKQLKQEGLDVHFYALDVTNEESIQKLALDIKERFGSLDILINNAGIYIDGKNSILDIDLDTVRKTMETNVYGPLRLSQVLVPLLQVSGDGRIVNVSSGMGAIEDLGGLYPSYSLSKTALNVLTIQLADVLRDRGVLVNSMCPGWVRTEMGGSGATRSVAEGADTAVWLATGNVGRTGLFFRDRKEISW
ncbi:SDR family oxidoreductase [Bacillus sp. 1P10SD]|uniref:SDR family oxidoreductase n=1 Tax=Bacillus sp. 1P10SD TaxID=3132265 RepID=UPI0039A7083B